MSWGTNVLSLGGLVVGLGVIVWHGLRWHYTGGKQWKKLVLPFVPLMAYGMLLILSAGGILGGAAGIALWGSNKVGDITLVYGVGGHTQNATRTVDLVLTNAGHMMVVLMTVAMAVVWVYKKNIKKLDLFLFVLCGISLGLSGGIAGVAAQALGPAVDSAGGMLAGVL